MSGFDKGFPDIIEGRSLIKKNKKVETDLNTIRLNKNTVLHSICPPSEGIPPERIRTRPIRKTTILLISRDCTTKY